MSEKQKQTKKEKHKAIKHFDNKAFELIGLPPGLNC